MASGEDQVNQETESLSSEELALIQRFTVRVVQGPDAGKQLQSTSSKLSIGSHEANDLCLTDTSLSRFHCELRVEDTRIFVEDLGSRNGTHVNGVAVLQAYLGDGATLTLGRSLLEVSLNQETTELPLSERNGFGLAVGSSRAMRALFYELERVSRSETTILLTGETGTGKDLLARSIHQESDRRSAPFVVLDCAALPRELLASEIFGHEKGAFTGADRTHIGAVEQAEGGTLFLDELGELPLDLQPNLLRLLENREYRRVGSKETRKADVRVIAATHRDLKREVNERTFRADLYFRIAVVNLEVPPLRERLADLPLLIATILEYIGDPDEVGRRMLLGKEGLKQLQQHRWEGNVRELRNYVERCVVMGAPAKFDRLGTEDEESAPTPQIDKPYADARDAWNRSFELAYWKALLERHNDNVSAAARAAGIDRVYLHRLLKRAGLR